MSILKKTFAYFEKLVMLRPRFGNHALPAPLVHEAHELMCTMGHTCFVELQREVLTKIAETYYNKALSRSPHGLKKSESIDFNIYDMVKDERELLQLVCLGEKAWKEILVQMIAMSLHAKQVMRESPAIFTHSSLKIIDVTKLRRSSMRLLTN